MIWEEIRYVEFRLTGNAAAGNTYNVVDMASLLQAVRNAGEQAWLLFGPAHTMNGTAA